MQTKSPAPPAPQTPATPETPQFRVGKDGALIPTAPGTPLTRQQYNDLKAWREDLSTQLNSAVGRREDVVEELAEASADERPGLLERLKVLDDRIVRLEKDIDFTGRELTSRPREFSGTAGIPVVPPIPAPRGMPGGMVAIFIVFTIFVLMPLAIAGARRMWKRGSGDTSASELRDIAQRLDRLEQAVDTVAVEMERVSEGQRFVSRVLSEGAPAMALGAGERPAEPLRVSNKDATRVPRGES